MIILYGIPNCDTVKKAKAWLENVNIEYQFHDFRKHGIDDTLVRSFCDALGWGAVLNKRSSTFRQLSAEQKENANEHHVVSLLLDKPTLIKRPILAVRGQFYVGFNPEQYQQIFML